MKMLIGSMLCILIAGVNLGLAFVSLAEASWGYMALHIIVMTISTFFGINLHLMFVISFAEGMFKAGARAAEQQHVTIL